MESPSPGSTLFARIEAAFETGSISSSDQNSRDSKEGTSTPTLSAGHENGRDLEKAPTAENDKEEAQPVVSSTSPSVDFPDGGFQAWSVVFGGWCCLFASFGWVMSMGVFQHCYRQVSLHGYSHSTIAWIPSMQTCIMFLGAPVFGKIFDNYGPRPLLVFGSFFQVFGMMMLSISDLYYQIFLAQVGRWFAKRRALATGIVSSGSSTGGVVVSIMTERLIPRIGFGWTVRVVAFLYLFLLILASITVRSRLEHRRSPFVVLDFFRPLKLMPVLLTALASFVFFLGVFIPFDFLIVQARHEGMSQDLAISVLAIMHATSAFGRILPAWAGDKFGLFNVVIITTYLSAVFALAVWIPAVTNAVIIVFAALYGFSSGAFVAMIPAVVAQLSPITELGLRLGTNSIAVSVAVLLGNPIGGALISASGGGFVGLQAFAGATMFVGASLFVWARMVQKSALLERI